MTAAAIERFPFASASHGSAWTLATKTQRARTWASSGASSSAAAVVLRAAALPEGVWLVTSDQVPGLVVEADNRPEALALARALLWDLVALDGLPYRRGETQVISIG